MGKPVAARLKSDGFEVRLFARDPAKAQKVFGDSYEIAPGDVTNHGQVEAAMRGCNGVHISIGGEFDRLSAETVAELAPSTGVEYITYVSGSTVCPQNGWFPMIAQKLEAEKAIRECGVGYTIFCPTWPMEQLPRFVRDGRAAIIGEQPAPLHWFACEDFGRMVSNAYQRENSNRQRLFIHGPEAIPMKEALERYIRVFHPEIKSVTVMPVWLAKSMGVLTRNPMLKFFAELMNYFNKTGELGDGSETNRLLGAPEITLETWLESRQTNTE